MTRNYLSLLPELERAFSVAGDSSNYPRYNIWEQDDRVGIEIAALGLKKDMIDVTYQSGVLIVEAQKVEREKNVKFLDKGISDKGFKKAFRIGINYVVDEVTLSSGILTILLKKEVESKNLIPIKEL